MIYQLLKTKIFQLINKLGFVCILILSNLPQKLNAQFNLTVNPELHYQSIDGFGASDAWRTQFVGENWPNKKKNKIAELLFSKEFDQNGNPKGIGLSLWRFYLSAGSTEQGESSGIKSEWRRGESFIDSKGNYDWSKQAGQQWFLKSARDYGVEKFLAFSIAAPTFWSINGKGWNEGRTNTVLNLKMEKYDDFADYLTEFLRHFQREGFHFDYLSPINEPQWNWEKPTQEGTPATNENVARLVRLINKQLERKNLDTKIVVSEAADLRFLYSDYGKPNRGDLIDNFFGDSNNENTYIRNCQNVKPIISSHSYFTTWPVDSLISIRKKVDVALKANDLGYWQSEFCILEKNDDITGGGKRDLGINTALYVARVIHADLTLANSKSWQWWTAVTRADFKDGLIYIDTGDKSDLYNSESLKSDGEFHDSKLLWALGNYSRFIRPGMLRISSEINNHLSLKEQYHDLMVSSYMNPESNDLVIVAVNYSEENKVLKETQNNIEVEYSYTTSSDRNLRKEKIEEGNINIPARSIVTITGKIKNKI